MVSVTASPRPILLLIYDTGIQCDAVYIGLLTDGLSAVQGLVICRDGSGTRGFWRGTVMGDLG